ncbi:LLM class F420-dependent oxidoreductase [Actinosynnema sp. NPDC020468]|uniref:LLM class F420-dependent oxidoreductase n=1 Tax=Actinosynnema sp. NPDC020468 TaxID=3154488 RepID=UPI0033CE7F75
MEYAVVVPVAVGKSADPAWIDGFARHVEACGFESVVVVEHTVVVADYRSAYPYAPSGRMGVADDCPVPDPLDLLAFLAARTTTLGLATGVLVLPNHHPVGLAKRVATVDALSGGRVRLCVGMGWMREEVEACGVAFGTRGRRADEQIDVLRALWADGPATHEGEFFRFADALSHPKPAHRVPIHVGGHSTAAARRAGRRGDGLQPLGATGDEVRRLVAVMREEAGRAGRDPDALELSLGHHAARIDLDKAAKLAALGATRVVLSTSDSADLLLLQDELSACAERLGLR